MVQIIKEFRRTLETSNAWISDVAQYLETDDLDFAYHVLKAVLHTLRDRITIEESKDLAAQFPTLIRGIYYEGWNPSKVPIRMKDMDDFYKHVSRIYGGAQMFEPEKATAAVMKLLSHKISEGELEDIKAILPKGMVKE